VKGWGKGDFLSISRVLVGRAIAVFIIKKVEREHTYDATHLDLTLP
jgi:hypothetical protein